MKTIKKGVLWPSTRHLLTFLHIFDHFGLKLTPINIKLIDIVKYIDPTN